MPRSGTKLLRSILNNHPDVAIPEHETNCLPHFYTQFKQNPQYDFETFYQDFSQTTFFEHFSADHPDIAETFKNSVTGASSHSDALSMPFTLHSDAAGAKIWGIKTPLYLLHLPLLAEVFPEARFLHIIRDPRDYSLSVKKSWGNHVLRAAQKWRNSVGKCCYDGSNLDQLRYFEIKYELLTATPEETISQICSFLNIQYDRSMIEAVGDKENTGDARGASVILKDNSGKWQRHLSERSSQRIEEICFDLMRDLGYHTTFNGPQQRLSSFEENAYRLYDGLNFVYFLFRHHSFKVAAKYLLNSRKHLLNRKVGKAS